MALYLAISNTLNLNCLEIDTHPQNVHANAVQKPPYISIGLSLFNGHLPTAMGLIVRTQFIKLQ